MSMKSYIVIIPMEDLSKKKVDVSFLTRKIYIILTRFVKFVHCKY